MKRNPVAWAATLGLDRRTGELIGSSPADAGRAQCSRGKPEDGPCALSGVRVGRRIRSTLGRADQCSEKSRADAEPAEFSVPGPGGRPNPGIPNNPRDLRDFEEMLKKFFGPDGSPEQQQFGGRGTGTGSGFVYDSRGHIVTNNHVVEGAEKITVAFHDGTEATATVVGTDSKADIAVIKVDNSTYPPLPKGDSSKLKVGELVMAVGSPFELSQSVTTGIISATERNNVGINEYESFLQTDAPINPGNSGGPLVNMSGEVIGVNSAIVTGGRGNDGIGFAVPIDMAANVADQLIKDGKVHRVRIGIRLGLLTPVLAKQLGLSSTEKGILVEDVVKGSPADKAGLKQGDVIVGFGGDKIESIPTFRLKVAASPIDKSFDIDYYRDGRKHTASILPAPARTWSSISSASKSRRKAARVPNPSRPRSATSVWKSSRSRGTLPSRWATPTTPRVYWSATSRKDPPPTPRASRKAT